MGIKMEHKIKIVAVDMDGTLLNSKKVVSDYTIQVLKQALEKGVYIVPATGRTPLGLPDELNQMSGLRYGIFFNGAIVYDMLKKKPLYTDYMEVDTTIELLKFAEKYDVMCDIYIDGFGYCEGRWLENLAYYNIDPHMIDLVHRTRKPVDNLVDFLKNYKGPIEKMNIFFHDSKERLEAMEAYKELGNCKVVSSLGNNIELNSPTCSKGISLMRLAEYLNIDKSGVMACGDATNDLEMIELAGFGVAMENGMEEVKEIADYVTDSNDDDGVAKAIEKFVF